MFSVAQHSCCKSAYVQIALSRLSKWISMKTDE
jgi:hypothetical protein